MNKYLKLIILVYVFLVPIMPIYSQNIIFLHHSTGAGVYDQGNVEEWINNYNTNHATNYVISELSYPNSPYPWENYPYDYWNLWINNACNNDDPDIACLENLCVNYDVVIFKHCFPGSDILPDDPEPSVSSSRKSLENYKLQYRALRGLMDTYPENKFIVWTLAPLHRLATSAENAERARTFVNWVKDEWLMEDGKDHPNINIFDFFGYVAESDPTPENGQLNCLKYDYEGSHTGSDSHPNTLANQTVGPIFAQFIINTIENAAIIKVTGITVTGAGDATSITTDNGTLQLNAAVSPDNATNTAVIWSVQNGTGQASINPSGLVTAIADGTVTAIASATDGSGITGSLELTITGQTPEIVLVSDIIVTGEDLRTSISEPGGTLQLYATVMPEDATNKAIIWSLQNGSGYAAIDPSGLLSAIADGTATAMAAATDGSGTTGVLDITITNQNVPTGIRNPGIEPPDIIVHGPDLTVRFSDRTWATDVALYDIMGNQMHKQVVHENTCRINMGGIPSGVYVLVIRHPGGSNTVKVMIP